MTQKRWVQRSNDKLHPIGMNIGMHVKNIYRKVNTTVGFSKYEFNNKLLVSVTFFRVI